MQRLSEIAIASAALLVLAVSSIIALGSLPVFRIDGFSVEAAIDCPSVSSVLLKSVGSNYLKNGRKEIEGSLEALPFVKSIGLSFSRGRVIADLSFYPEGAVLASESNAFFYDGEKLTGIERRDVPGLRGEYPVIGMSNAYMDYIRVTGIPEGLKGSIAALKSYLVGQEGKDSLITTVKYDNNKNSGKGETEVSLPSLCSTLRLADGFSPAILEECIKLIEEDVYQRGGATVFSDVSRYELYQNTLIRLKG